MPIKKYSTQSALNNFRELTMENPDGIARYIGFTETAVRALCREHKISFAGMKKWYDGYVFRGIGHVYSPNFVMEAIESGEFRNYWSRTETYESLKLYIEMDFDRLKQKIVDMLAGKYCKVNTDAFQNDMTTFKSADDVLTLLIHLGYLAYNGKTKETFIPNEDVRSTFQLSVMDDNWAEGAIRQIKDKWHFEAAKEYKGNLLLVRINYDVKSKKHECVIEKDGE